MMNILNEKLLYAQSVEIEKPEDWPEGHRNPYWKIAVVEETSGYTVWECVEEFDVETYNPWKMKKFFHQKIKSQAEVQAIEYAVMRVFETRKAAQKEG